MKTTIVIAVVMCAVLGLDAANIACAQEGRGAAASGPSADVETKEQRDARMKWWREARFGMFIHWGVYSVPAGVYEDRDIGGLGEWIMNRGRIPVARYKEYAKQFNPVKYDPEAWVQLAKEAGMKYIVITSKHHDGFALFDSAVTDWDVVDATPYGKDLLKPLAEACRKHDLVLGFYYSQAQDWNHPGGAASGGHWDPAQDGDMDEYVREIAVPQVREILSHYGKLGILWWDTPTNMNRERADMLRPLLSLQTGIITNNRLGGGFPGDTETPEQFIPATGYPGGRDWETCMTINGTWGFKLTDTNWKSSESLIRNLVDIASKGGNYLLNVGPTSLGEIPEASVERLKDIGKWMKVNSEAIYATDPNPFPRTPPTPTAGDEPPRRGRGRGGAPVVWDWRATTKFNADGSGKIYLHIFQWPADGKFSVTSTYKANLVKAYLLADPSKALDGNVTTTDGAGSHCLSGVPGGEALEPIPEPSQRRGPSATDGCPSHFSSRRPSRRWCPEKIGTVPATAGLRPDGAGIGS